MKSVETIQTSEEKAITTINQIASEEWMDTSGPIRGLLVSGKIAFAVSKSNVFNPNYEYIAPPGYHWATFNEFQKLYGPPYPVTSNGRIFNSNYGWSGSEGDTYN
eukprot:gene29314-38841_t